MSKVKVQYKLTDDDCEVSVGSLGSFAFVKGVAEMDNIIAEELTRQSPHFVIVEEKSNARSDSKLASTDGSEKGVGVGDGSSP